MTFKELQDELISVPAARFKEGQRASVKKWLNLRYAELWGVEDWTFRRAQGTVTVTAGNSTAAAPSDFGDVLGFWRDDGEVLRYMFPRDYFDSHLASPSASGSPCRYTLINGAVLLDPTPSANASYTVYYDRKLTPLVNDNDVPLIPVEHHYILVHGATATGSVQMNDFTYQFAEQQWQNQLDAMRRNYLEDAPDEPLQWGSYLTALGR